MILRCWQPAGSSESQELTFSAISLPQEACWTISNITAGTKEQIQSVVEAGILPPLVHLLGTAEFDIKKEAAWALSNATSGGSHDQIKYLVQIGCIKPLCDLLVCSDVRIVTVALEGLENILKVRRFFNVPVCFQHVCVNRRLLLLERSSFSRLQLSLT